MAKESVKEWRGHHRERVASKAGAASQKPGGANKRLPVKLQNVNQAKQWVVPAVGSSLWHEAATNRIRASYVLNNTRLTSSSP
eukprot:2688547-Lingulodinium_polyedra.AAC.1